MFGQKSRSPSEKLSTKIFYGKVAFFLILRIKIHYLQVRLEKNVFLLKTNQQYSVLEYAGVISPNAEQTCSDCQRNKKKSKTNMKQSLSHFRKIMFLAHTD